jgi:hypothetical protein
MRRRRNSRKVTPAASGSEWESVKRLAAVDAANGWPWDLAMMLVVYALLRLLGLLVSPFLPQRPGGNRPIRKPGHTAHGGGTSPR